MKQEINVVPINVVLNRENKFNRSYKVTVKSVDKQQIFNPEVWDNNIIVKDTVRSFNAKNCNFSFL